MVEVGAARMGDIVFGWARRGWRYEIPAVTKKRAYRALEREGEGTTIFGERWRCAVAVGGR